MPTTFHAVNFLNRIVVAIHHTSSPGYLAYYAEPYSGAQPANPSDIPVGSRLVALDSFIVGPSLNMPVDGVSNLAASVSANATETSTVGFVRLRDTYSESTIDTTVGLAGSGAGCILSSLSTSTGAPITITNLDIKMPYDVGGTLKLNSALVNQLVKMLLGASTALQMGINGSILVYSGAAPADADMAATGTLLATIPTGAVTPWNTTATAGACNLVSSISALASATGTAGYVRWTKGAYTIQGSVGTSAADFILDSVSLVSGVSVTLTEATITLAS